MKTFILIIAAFISTQSYAASDTLSSTVSKATVFLSGAQVFRDSKSFTVDKGVNEVIIKDVSPYLNPNQLQASAKGNFLILDVQFRTEYVQPSAIQPTIVPAKIQKELDWLADSLLFISFEKEQITAKLGHLNNEKQMIIQNQLIKNGGISDTLPELKQVVEFYRQKLDEIHSLIHEWKKKQHYVNQRDIKHRARQTELNQYIQNIGQPVQPARTRYHIAVTTYAEATTTGRIQANYYVQNAGWIPAYDLRAENVSDPMQITYKANVYQNTGEDWDNVKLTLSTYNQNCFTTKPSVGIWRLDYTINKQRITPSSPVAVQFHAQNMASEVELSALKDGLTNNGYTITNQSFTPLSQLSEISENFTNVEFNVKLPYSVKADGSQKLMVISHEKVDAHFFHFLAPRANKNGFLIAKIGDWENLNLLPGKANIYFNHTIVGSTQIDPTIMSDSLELSLGRDQGVTSSRKKINEIEKKVALGKRTLRTMEFEIEVKNNSKGTIQLTLEDQIPVTVNDDIEIKLLQSSGAAHDEKTGKIVWNLKLKPGAKRIVKFSYSVEHERNKPIS